MTLAERREQIAQMSKSVFQYCLTRTGSYQDSEDLSQEILLALCESIENLRDEKAFYAFVWRTADNILKGWYRSRDRRNTAELDETLPDDQWARLAEQAQENEQLSLVVRELAHLNSSYRRVTVAYYIDGLSVRDISARFSITQSMVKYLLFQSRKRLKEGIEMERNYGAYSYNPVKLNWRWLCRPVRDYGAVLPLSSICQNILMACYYDKQNEEQLSMLLGVPTAYLEDEIRKLIECELLTEKNGFYLTNVIIHTKKEIAARAQAKEPALKGIAAAIADFFDAHEAEFRAVGFYGNDMSRNSLKWLVLTRMLDVTYGWKVCDALDRNYPDGRVETWARILLIEAEEAPKGDNYDPLWMWNQNEQGYIRSFWIRFNSPVFQRLSDVQANMLLSLPTKQPETEQDKLICAELIEKGCAVRIGCEIKPNYPCMTAVQNDALNALIEPICQRMYESAMSRLEMTRDLTREYIPERFARYAKDMIVSPMYDEMSDLMRILVEENWLVPWTGMNPTNQIVLSK